MMLSKHSLEVNMLLTKSEVARALPSHLRSSATQDLTDKINNISKDPIHAENIRENFISYSGVLQDGRFKMDDYINAVTYVSYKLMGYNNTDSYYRTFPDRHAALVARGASAKDISSYVSAYNKNKLVNLILEQSLIPTWVLNQDVYQKAINAQVELMMDAKSETVRTMAANSILTHLAKPKEAATVQLNINSTENSALTELSNTLTQLAQKQKELIESGVSTKSIAESQIIEGDYEEE